MTHALEDARALRPLAEGAPLLAFDFDGTLAPIVADRDAASMRTRTRGLLSALCARFPCAVISGRSLEDLGARVDGLGLRHLVGGHGLEPCEDLSAFEALAAEAAGHLGALLAGAEGIDLERKPGTLSVHYRHAPNRREALERIETVVASIPVAMRTIPGRLVVNLVPVGSPHKGDALKALMRKEGARVALYAGDDETDEDAFRLGHLEGVVGVRIGRSATSSATHYLRNQEELDLLLERLLELGRGSPGA